MLLVMLTSIWRTPVKNIRRQLSEYSSTYVVLLMFVFILGEREMELLGSLTPILLEILIREDLLLGMCFILKVALSVGKLLCRLQLCC